ncbi:MAG: VanZ family protein [Deltaproteobacteria bacterium]|nr:VanZ family protein [Deltaproteobacteria bacterium]
MLWVGVITWLSSDRFSDEQTASWLTRMPFLSALGLPPATIDAVNLILRKTAHFVEYATLSVLAYRALGLGDPSASRARRLLSAVGLAVGCAAMDEFHQTLTLTRTGSLKDLFINSLGAIAGASLAARLLAQRWPTRAA